MRCFEFHVASSAVSTNGGPYIPDDRLLYDIPEEAQELLEPILDQYGQSPMWYFDKLNFGRPPAAWAIACLDREYPIAGHIANYRPDGSGIAFSPYMQVPNPIPQEFVPQVGVVVLANKRGLEHALDKSPIFQTLWEGLRERSSERRWLLLLDPLSEEWLTQVEPGDRQRWLSTR
jgi:hypothetical protein